MCPLPGASELLDRRHPNFRDFRSKAVLWQEKPSASLCKTPMNFRAAKLEGSILWRSLWLCDMLHIFHHLACPRNGSNWRLKSVSGMRRNSGRFTAGVFRARALQHLTFHHCIRSDTHARAHTHTGCQAALDFLFQIAFMLLAMRVQVFSDSLHGRCAFKAAALNWLTLSACWLEHVFQSSLQIAGTLLISDSFRFLRIMLLDLLHWSSAFKASALNSCPVKTEPFLEEIEYGSKNPSDLFQAPFNSVSDWFLGIFRIRLSFQDECMWYRNSRMRVECYFLPKACPH